MGFVLFSNKKNIRQAKQAAGQQQYASAKAMEAVAAEQARGQAIEATKAHVFGLLGSEGSYDDPTSAPSGGAANVFSTSSVPDIGLRKMMSFTNKAAKDQLMGPRAGILDPEAYGDAISKSSLFRSQSFQVAEAEQLLKQKGPIWDMLENSVIGTINEGAALQLRDTVRQLKNDAAKGGTARRTALHQANNIRAQEEAMRTRVQQTWQAKLSLHAYARQNADRVSEGSQRFVDNLPLLNASYRDAMQKVAALQVDASNVAIAGAVSAYNTRQSQVAKRTGAALVESLVGLVATAVATYYGGPATGAAVSKAFGEANADKSGTQVGAPQGAEQPAQSGGFDFSNLFNLFGSSGGQGGSAMGSAGFDPKG